MSALTKIEQIALTLFQDQAIAPVLVKDAHEIQAGLLAGSAVAVAPPLCDLITAVAPEVDKIKAIIAAPDLTGDELQVHQRAVTAPRANGAILTWLITNLPAILKLFGVTLPGLP